jgi:truncated hemoglobin YjbI
MVFEFDDFGFKFGLYASAITEKEAGVPISKVIEGMGRGEILPILQYFYGAAVSYNEAKGRPKVTISQVSDLIEKLGFDKAMGVFNDSLQMPKNSEAPKETGQS